MAIPKPEKFDSIDKNVTKSEKTAQADEDGALIIDNFHNLVYKNKNADEYKSLDFSDVAIYGSKDSTTKEDEKFRHFHQMRLFIEKAETLHHRGRYNGKTIITCNLPEQIQYALNSEWKAPLNFGDPTFNLMMQLGGESTVGAPSGTLRVSSLKVWQNTQPLTLKLTIPVIDDGFTDENQTGSNTGTNLVEALEVLGSLCLPRYGGEGFYIPPPSPLDININYTAVVGKDAGKQKSKSFGTANHARIMLQLGGVLLVDNCIIENVTVQYPNTKAQIRHRYSTETFGTTAHDYLHPLLAVVTLTISTLEGLTENTYSQMLWARTQPNQGSFTADIDKATKIAYDIKESIIG